MQRLHTPQEAARWLRQRVRGTLRTDSRQVRAGDAFLAWPGARHDARRYLPAVLAQGASACLIEADNWSGPSDTSWVAHADQLACYAGLKSASGPIASAYHDSPSERLDVLAVTGTNGKTSTAWWLAQALSRLGHRCAVAGTLGLGEVQQGVRGRTQVQGLDTGFTTPDAVLWQGSLRDFADRGIRACAVEASSIGLAEHRLDGTRVRVAVFTNFTQDHLDYHGDMRAYWLAKRALFDWQGLQAAVLNVDDPKGQQLVQELQSRQDSMDLWTCSAMGPARVWARDIRQGDLHADASTAQHRLVGLSFDVVEGEQSLRMQTAMMGHYNVNNLLGVVASLRALGHSLEQAVQVCSDLWPVPGRLQAVSAARGPLVLVDYAHSPDALEQVLKAVRPVALQRQGRVVCVVGCGGDRDAVKRPLMARAAQDHSDRQVFTSDNPRSENPQAILDAMLAGLQPGAPVELEVDRARAIAQAIAQAAERDVVLIAGKGHEQYQEIAGVRHPFSDEVHAQRALDSWSAA